MIIKEGEATDDVSSASKIIILENWFEELRRLVPTN